MGSHPHLFVKLSNKKLELSGGKKIKTNTTNKKTPPPPKEKTTQLKERRVEGVAKYTGVLGPREEQIKATGRWAVVGSRGRAPVLAGSPRPRWAHGCPQGPGFTGQKWELVNLTRLESLK